MINEVTYKGKWKLPDEENWINGTLSFDPDFGAKLELFGTFNPNFSDRSTKDIILGKTTKGDITLIENLYRTKKVVHNGVIIGVYEPICVIKGHHFQKESDINFEKVIFKTFNLFQWFALTGQKHDFRNESSSYSLHYEEISNIEFELNENCKGHIGFDAPINVLSEYNKVEFHEEASVNLFYSEQVHYKKILDDITKFIRLMTLLTFEQSYPIEITFKDKNYINEKNKYNKEKYIKCLYWNSFYSEKHKLRNQGEHVVMYSEIKDIFPNVIQNWFEIYEEIESVIILTLKNFKNKYWFSTDNFMDSIRALESYHRMNYNNDRIPKDEYDKLVDKIKEQVDISDNDRKWLNAKLKGNEPSLSTRIKELVNDNQNEYLTQAIVDLNKFCYKATDSRNYYTHYSKDSKNGALEGVKLSELTRIIRGILFSCILKRLQIDKEHFEKGLVYNLQ